MTKRFDLNMHTARLLMDEPFFAAVSRRINKRESNAIPTAGVMVNPDTGHFEMLYNPEFFDRLTDEEMIDVLKHEYYHIIYLHVTQRMPEGVPMKRWNIATDLAINSHLHNLPAGGLIPGQPGTPFESLPRGKSAEWYLNNLPDLSPKDGEKSNVGDTGDSQDSNDSPDTSNGQGSKSPSDGDSEPYETLDDHSGWGECSQEMKDIATERLKDIVRKAAEECNSQSRWGTVSRDCKKQISKMLETKIDWRKVLRYFVKTSQRANKSSSIKRINRRYAYVHPGRKTNRVAKVAVSIDQSGSVSDDMLVKFFAELNKLAQIAEFTVIPFDTRVEDDYVYVWKKNKSFDPTRVLFGGTCFNAPTEYVNERDFDGHIVLTDLCAPKPKASKCQRMWMTTPEYAQRPYFSTNEKIVSVE